MLRISTSDICSSKGIESMHVMIGNGVVKSFSFIDYLNS